MASEKPPKDASAENLLELCEELREGERTREYLSENISQSKTLVRENLRYGVALGFITETEEGYKASPRGVEASYNQDNSEKLAKHFQEGLNEYQVYKTAVEEIAKEDFSAGTSPITKSDVLRIFRTSVGLEGSESTLGDRATTFIQTLEKAGLGEYVVGRRGNESRLEIIEGFDTVVEQILDQGKESEKELDNQENAESEKKSQPGVIASAKPGTIVGTRSNCSH